MTILPIAIENLGGGGAERVALDLARHWPRDHARPVLLLARKTGVLLSDVPADVEVLEVGVCTSPRRSPAFLARLRRVLDGRKLAGMIAHMTPMNRMMLRAAVLGIVKAPVVAVEHNDFVVNSEVARMNPLKWFLLRQEIGFLYRRAHRVVGCSQGVARQVGALFGLASERVTAIVNPLDRRFVNPAPNGTEIELMLAGLPRPVLVSAGRLVPQKGFDDLIRAFAILPRGSLVILGEGPLRGELEALAQSLGVSSKVLMPGFVTAPEQVLRRADLYVSASHWEGYPLTLVEAYASGLPVVARDCNFGPREIVTPDRPGRLVTGPGIDALASAISATLETQPRFTPGIVVDLSVNDPVFVARQYRRLFEDASA